MRPKGHGSVQRNGHGWRWSRQVGGKQITGRTRPTREEALTELDRLIDDPTFVPEPPRSHRESAAKATATKRDNTIAKLLASLPPPEEIPCPTDAEVAAAERKVRRWSKRGKDGKRRCLPCNGTGIDTRPGQGAGRACLACWGGEF